VCLGPVLGTTSAGIFEGLSALGRDLLLVIVRNLIVVLVVNHVLHLVHAGFLIQTGSVAHLVAFLLENHEADESLGVLQGAAHELVEVL